MKVMRLEIELNKTPNGGWTKSQLAKWGVKWPPSKGWKERLMRGLDPNTVVVTSK